MAIRDLVRIGKSAVPPLIQELDRTTEECPLRSLGLALRAIGDPRAVPALWRRDHPPRPTGIPRRNALDPGTVVATEAMAVTPTPGRPEYEDSAPDDLPVRGLLISTPMSGP
jgi:hypothetical protein